MLRVSVRAFFFLLFIGERYDFVINAEQPVGAYWIQVRGLGECGRKRVQQLGILRYARGPYQPTARPPTYDVGLPQGVVSINLFLIHFLLIIFVYVYTQFAPRVHIRTVRTPQL